MSLMAYSAKPLSFFLLLVLVLFSSPQIQARESKAFNKFTHITTNNKVPESEISPVEAPTPAPALAPTPAPETENAYGLYGNVGSNRFSPTKETQTTITDESNLLNEELVSGNYETGNQNNNYNNNYYTSSYKNGYSNTGYTNVNYNKGYSNNYNTNGYETEKQGMSDTRFMQYYNNDDHTSNYNNNEYYNTNGYETEKQGMSDTRFAQNYNNNEYYNNNGYETEKQGMSDTRFLENGKYSYHLPTGYESERQSGTVKNEGYYGNTQNEFNTMEEYEKQQGYYEP